MSLENTSEAYKPTKLAVCGGGVKGRAYAPVIKALDETNLLGGIKDVYGSSVGAILSSMLSLGFSAKEIQRQLDSDSSPYQDAAKAHDPSLPKVGMKILRNMLKDGALFKGEKLSADCQALVQQGGLEPNATFGDLKKLVDSGAASSSGMPYRNLHVTATVVDKRGSYQIILDAQTAPNMPIALAIRASAALPPAFRPVIISPEQMKKFTEGATEKLVQYDRGSAFHNKEGIDTQEVDLTQKIKLIDGGLVDNLPQYVVQKDSKPDPTLLSLNLRGTQYMEQKKRYEDILVDPNNEEVSNRLEQKYRREREALEGTLERAFKHNHKICFPPSRLLATRENTIDILTHDVDAADFGMESKKHQRLLDDGHEAVVAMLKSKGVDTSKLNPAPTIMKPEKVDDIDSFIVKTRISLSETGLLKPKLSEVKKLSNQARSILRKGVKISDIKGNTKAYHILHNTHQNFQAINSLSNEVIGVLRAIDQEIKIKSAQVNTKETISILKQQRNVLLDYDQRLKMAVKIHRFEQIESASHVAGAGFVKNMAKGLWKERRQSQEIVNEVLINNSRILLKEIEPAKATSDTEKKIKDQIDLIDQALKAFKKLKAPEENQMKIDLQNVKNDLVQMGKLITKKNSENKENKSTKASPSSARAPSIVFSKIRAHRMAQPKPFLENRAENTKPTIGEHRDNINKPKK